MDVCDLGGGSGPPRLHTGSATNDWVKKNHHTRGERLKITTYNVRTLLKDEHVQELEEELRLRNIYLTFESYSTATVISKHILERTE